MKRILSILLALTMVLSLSFSLNLVAFAAFDYEAAEISGEGTEENPYIIDSEAKFTAIFGEANTDAESYGKGIYYKVTKTLTLDSHKANKMVFKGVLCADENITLSFGNLPQKDWWLGSAITGLSTSSISAYSALFPITNGATIKNITIEGTMYNGTGSYAVGPFAAVAIDTTFENCNNNMTVICTAAGKDKVSGVGGFVGTALGNTIFNNCVNNGEVNGKQNVGGIVGFSQYAAASVSEGATDKVFGGEINNCKNYGTVTGGVGVGGILGDQENSVEFTSCTNYGNVTTNNTWSRVGGIVGGQRYFTTISKCANYGDITLGNKSNSYAVGGIVGYVFFNGYAKVLIEECMNKGNIKSDFASGYASAIIGKTDNNVQVDNSFNIGSVSGGANQGFVVGHASNKTNISGITIRQFYDIGAANINGIIGKNDSSAELIINKAYILSETPDETYIENALNKASKDTLKGLISSGLFAESVWEIKADNAYGYPTLKAVPYFIEGPDSLDSATTVFTSDSGEAMNVQGVEYTTYALIAGKAPQMDGYTLKEFGVVVGYSDDITIETGRFKFTPLAEKIIQPSGAFGCLLYNTQDTVNGFKPGKQYFARPYAVYESAYGAQFNLYGEAKDFSLNN